MIDDLSVRERVQSLAGFQAIVAEFEENKDKFILENGLFSVVKRRLVDLAIGLASLDLVIHFCLVDSSFFLSICFVFCFVLYFVFCFFFFFGF